ncbi:hypothetical protein [Stappia sp.]|uniref:hypothetical protein n=1 Tax=Stappia sp. TaxID=1870903 RepID=UPI0032D90B6D
MPSLAEIQRSTAAAWNLLLNRPGALAGFDTSFAGFWRSFSVILLLLPLVALASLSEARVLVSGEAADVAPLSLELFLTARAVALGLDWVFVPLVLALIAGPLGVGAGYVAYVVVRNWSALVMALVTAPLFALHLIGFLPGGLLMLFLLVATLVFVRYRYIATRVTLGCPPVVAGGVVVLEYLSGIVLSEATARLFGL